MKHRYQQNWYTPREIAEKRMIVNSRGDMALPSGNYAYVLRLIKNGTLKAKVYNKGKRPNYLVPESEIKRYHETVESHVGQ